MRRIKAEYSGAAPLAYFKAITIAVFLHADTTTIRLILANASVLWTAMLWESAFTGGSLFERPAYFVMRQFGSEFWWGLAFLIHFFGVYWRIYDPRRREWWGLAINGLGFVLWFIGTAAFNLGVDRLAPSANLEWILVICSGWALYRTGRHDDPVTA